MLVNWELVSYVYFYGFQVDVEWTQFGWIWQYPDSKVYGANTGPTWGRHDPIGPHENRYLG